MAESGIDGMLISGNANIFYTSARFFRGYTYVPSRGEAVYFVVRPVEYTFEGVKSFCIRKPEQIPSVMEDNAIPLPATLAVEEDALTYSEVMRLRKVFPDASAVDAGPVMRRARMQKTAYEIGQMKIDGLHLPPHTSHIQGGHDRRRVPGGD